MLLCLTEEEEGGEEAEYEDEHDDWPSSSLLHENFFMALVRVLGFDVASGRSEACVAAMLFEIISHLFDKFCFSSSSNFLRSASFTSNFSSDIPVAS